MTRLEHVTPSAGPDRSVAPGPARWHRRLLGQALFDVRAFVSNGEQLVLTVVLPLIVLLGLTRSELVELGQGRRVDLSTPGVLALALVSTAFTGQAIATGFDRRAGLLRLLGTTPLGRGGLLAGRVLAVLAVLVMQVVVLGGVALLLGWQPVWSGVPAAIAAAGLGAGAFVALGLLLAGTLRAEAVLAAANLIWVLLLAGGGVVLSPDRMGPAAPALALLPSAALGDALRLSLGQGGWPGSQLLVLAGWAVLASAAAVRWFRWD